MKKAIPQALRSGLGVIVVTSLTLLGTPSYAATASPAATATEVRPGTTVRDDLRTVFDTAGVRGTFALLDVSSKRTTVVDRRRAETPMVPASSFKVPHALVALETGVVKSPDEVIPWDGTPQPYPEWEKDMTMREAVRISNAAAFQVIARRIGLARERQWLHRLGYGNRQTGTVVDRFWLDGPLKISAVEQTRFMERLAALRLPASRANQRAVQDLILMEKKNGYTLYAKSGWQNAPNPGTGWWTGWVERGGRVYTFALNMDVTGDADAAKRATLARQLLHRLNVLPAA
ncbi:class D beta-lactamase [Nonomuraea sp. NPDC001023]|uniref:class D beta-lactamase n=1 Tax=unclassified Nonomuraea TaxID=2593643 RepID=UPI0033184FB3